MGEQDEGGGAGCTHTQHEDDGVEEEGGRSTTKPRRTTRKSTQKTMIRSMTTNDEHVMQWELRAHIEHPF